MLTKETILRHQTRNVEDMKKEIETEIDRRLISSLEFPVEIGLSKFPATLGEEVAKDYATKGGFNLQIIGFVATFS